MYKLKASKSIKKRFKLTSCGKYFRRQSTRSHLLQKKSSKRKRKLRKISFIDAYDMPKLKKLLF